MPNVILSWLAFTVYGVLAVYFWHAQVRGKGDVLSRSALGHWVVLPLSLHGYLLAQDVFAGGGFNLSMVNALSLIVWLTLLVYWVARFFYPVGGLQALVLPLAAVAVLLPEIFPAAHQLENTELFAFKAHIAAAMLAYSLFTIAMLHAVLISQVEKRLHHATLPRVLQNLPPLLTMETLLFRMIGIGFVLLSLTLASGVIFSEEIFGKAWQFNHKVLFGFISWGVFAVLLWGHRFHGWRGRIAVRWTVGGFVLLLLAYLGSKFVLEVLLGR
ncbi:ABC transporter permease [Ferrigenium kumadai]|uniref:ABC transporter permease n=1 Tax=Ferrigenium kumadai TaxID=1682490 RepID=A0AAN1VZL0_9PROT|nr:cytochrome c biogenesis protein CcsA [Ferrigenium kumadai]BBI98616.1 ABC transporter permease [Ferrigenium kumadai]